MPLGAIVERLDLLNLAVGFLGGIGVWIFNETRLQRKQRRQWYSDISGKAQRVIGTWANDGDIIHLESQTWEELEAVKVELTQLLNNPLELDPDVTSEARLLRDRIKEYTQQYAANHNDYDGVLTADSDHPINQHKEEIESIASDLAENAGQKANSGITIPILKTKI